MVSASLPVHLMLSHMVPLINKTGSASHCEKTQHALYLLFCGKGSCRKEKGKEWHLAQAMASNLASYANTVLSFVIIKPF